jgi:hypothetical protein
MTVQTAIQVVGEDVVGSLQCAPSMESMSDPALTSLLNFRTTSSESQPPSRMPKERRRRGQRDDCASAERRDEALERPLPPIRLRLLFWIDARTERQGERRARIAALCALVGPACHEAEAALYSSPEGLAIMRDACMCVRVLSLPARFACRESSRSWGGC